MSEDAASTQDKSPIEQAVEVLVYAPIGLLFEGSTILPQLVEKGRNQVTVARMIGKFAVQQGRTEALRTASKLSDQAAGVLDFLGDSLTPVQAEPPAPVHRHDRTPARRRPASTGRAAAAARTGAKVAPAGTGNGAGQGGPAKRRGAKAAAKRAPQAAPAVPAAAELAIPDYDGLSASHVVNRLAGLSAGELEAVRAYEAANRGRKTILNKIAQLQSA